jgi:hypothetical protein
MSAGIGMTSFADEYPSGCPERHLPVAFSRKKKPKKRFKKPSPLVEKIVY